MAVEASLKLTAHQTWIQYLFLQYVLLRIPSVLLDFPYKGYGFKSIESLQTENDEPKDGHSKFWLCRKFLALYDG
jgi:hypothetical protein